MYCLVFKRKLFGLIDIFLLKNYKSSTNWDVYVGQKKAKKSWSSD